MDIREYRKEVREDLKERFSKEISKIYGNGNKNRVYLKDQKYYDNVESFLKSENTMYEKVTKCGNCIIEFDIIVPEELKSGIDREIEELQKRILELKKKERSQQAVQRKLEKKKKLEAQLEKLNNELKSKSRGAEWIYIRKYKD